MLVVAGCGRPPVRSRPLRSAVVDHRPERLAEEQLKALLENEKSPGPGDERDGAAYRVGPGDTVLVAVYGHPELSISTYAGTNASAQGSRTGGLVVDNDGSIQFPLIGTVQVAGKTTSEMRVFLEQELARYIKEPKATVQVIFNGSIRYYLLGQFTTPGVKYSDRPLRLLEAMSLGGSITLERASLRTAYIARGQKRLPINFRRLIKDGDLSQNIRLRSGDIVVVPENTSETAFVFGAQGSGITRGGPVQFVNGQLNIMQALAQAGYGYRERFQARMSRTLVIRSDGDRGELFTVDLTAILKGDAAPFWLSPGDVVYLPATALTNFNLALEQLLPTLQTVASLLTPWVQIKYLERSN